MIFLSDVDPETLPTHTAVPTAVEKPVIQVCTPESVVPVLPASGVPSPVEEAPPVPPLITACIALVIPAATSGVTAWVQIDLGTCNSAAVCLTTTRSIAIGEQKTPLLATPATAAAIDSGAISLIPRIEAG